MAKIAAKVVKDGKTLAETSISIERPSWKAVYNGYPKVKYVIGLSYEEYDKPAEDVFKYIFEDDYYEKRKTIFSNACAVRVSIALLKAGITIGKKIKVVTTDNKIDEVETTEITRADSNLKGKRVILGASTMHGWLVKEWGQPKKEFTVTNPRKIGSILEKFKEKKGIYTMLPSNPEKFGGSTGHCTLWTGKNVIGGNHYAEEAYVVHLWELK